MFLYSSISCPKCIVSTSYCQISVHFSSTVCLVDQPSEIPQSPTLMSDVTLSKSCVCSPDVRIYHLHAFCLGQCLRDLNEQGVVLLILRVVLYSVCFKCLQYSSCTKAQSDCLVWLVQMSFLLLTCIYHAFSLSNIHHDYVTLSSPLKYTPVCVF